MRKVLFWNVDTQVDFMNEDGLLSIGDTVKLKSNLEWLSHFAASRKIQVINTRDWHRVNSAELSVNPDFSNTFPEHCIQNTRGAEFIDEVSYRMESKDMSDVSELDWDRTYSKEEYKEISNSTDIIINKDKFDVFTGNTNTDEVYVYGVTTDVCVNKAVLGLLSRGYKVKVIVDAIQELPGNNISEIVNGWITNGARLTDVSKVQRMFRYDSSTS